MTDMSGLDDQALADQIRAAEAELERRRTLAEQARRLDGMCRTWLEGSGVAQGDPWTQPTGFMGAFPRGWQVTHGGRSWRSLVPGAVLPPGTDQWTVTEQDPVPYWTSGAHSQGDLVQDDGRIWRALTDLTDGPAPSAFPGGWEPID